MSSSKIKSYCSPRCIFSRQTNPLSQVITLSALNLCKSLVATFKLREVSSTSKILIPCKSNVVLYLLDCLTILLSILWLTTTVNLEPSPYTVWTIILPPINSINCLVIARPRPVPSIVVFLSSSSLWNLVNILSIFSFLIPRPESSTEIINFETSLVLTQLTSYLTKPLSVYLLALLSKFVITFFKLAWSPYKLSGISGAI